MSIGLVYERANKQAYDALALAKAVVPGSQLAPLVTNEIFPSIVNKIGDTIIRSDKVSRVYDRFKLPLSEYGAITEYLLSNMVKAADSPKLQQGELVHDHVVSHPSILGRYSETNIRADYPMTITADRWMDAVEKEDIATMARMVALSSQSLYDGVRHDHDSWVPAIAGALYDQSPESSKIKIPDFDGQDIEGYSKLIYAILTKAVRDMTQWRRPDFNIPGAEMADSVDDLVLVSFDNPVDETGTTILDMIGAQLNLGSLARAKAIGQSLGLTVYEMPSPGIITNQIARAYDYPNLPGMQTADMSAGVPVKPYPNLRFALIGRGALNVGLKRLLVDTTRSSRGHFDQTWVTPVIQLAFGAGQAVFFETSASGSTASAAKTTTTTTK